MELSQEAGRKREKERVRESEGERKRKSSSVLSLLTKRQNFRKSGQTDSMKNVLVCEDISKLSRTIGTETRTCRAVAEGSRLPESCGEE